MLDRIRAKKNKEEGTNNDHLGPTESRTRKGKQGKKKKDVPN